MRPSGNHSETLDELISDTFRTIKQSETDTAKYSDFGSALGFVDAQNRIEGELRQTLLSLRVRAAELSMRVGKFEEGNLAVEMTKRHHP